MSKTKIEWCDWTCNCFWGCLNECSYCQAMSFARRFGKYIGGKRGYGSETIQRMSEFKPVWLPDQLDKIPKKPCRVFMSFMGDPFGSWNRPEWLNQAFEAMRQRPGHTFLMLTKQPQNLHKWSPFPKNCHVGVSVTTQKQYEQATEHLKNVAATVKFLSIEPLLEHIVIDGSKLNDAGISWVLLGQCTPESKKTAPKISWVKEIVDAADQAGIPVFLKFNLVGLIPVEEPFYRHWAIRQEFPKVHGL